MSNAKRVPATPEDELRQLRRAQEADRKRRRKITRRIKDRAKRIADWLTKGKLVRRLERAGVKAAWLVLTEADRAAYAADVPAKEFRAMALVVLKKETGIPQRAIYGCDWGPRSSPPYCNQKVTEANAAPFIRWVLADPFGGRMNGMHWTQTTWFEKLERVLRHGDPHRPQAHLRVCLGDLAVLRQANGVRDGFRAYNGSGAAAEAYASAAMALMPWARNLVR